MNNVYHSFLRVGENTKKNWESQFTVSICLTLPSSCLGSENQFALASKAFITIHFLDKSLNNIVVLNATNGKKLGSLSWQEVFCYHIDRKILPTAATK